MSNRYVPVDGNGVFDKVSGLVAPFEQVDASEVAAELNDGEGPSFEGYYLLTAVEYYRSLSYNEGKRFVLHPSGVLDTETGLVACFIAPPRQFIVDMFNDGDFDDTLDGFIWSSVQEGE